ncbi:hypothetical protein SLH46_21350 [Draconibacterium sp. IB214405]|uniref:hypothetical protein n=1 Tax=Draconibacterium sp. IB214405 TaxID=3097352 RepID=UPI002A0E24BD|nr:hypothetical protein [Draconibacterium sp. IB214405]MDX8341760.1 hypothetical protein [Draconibacterium sp. IB214405]
MLKKTPSSKSKKLKETTLPTGLKDETYKYALKNQLIYSIIGVFAGIVIVVLGIYLTMSGVESTTDEVGLEVLGAKLNLKRVAPGVILFFLGFFIIFITRFFIKSESDKK